MPVCVCRYAVDLILHHCDTIQYPPPAGACAVTGDTVTPRQIAMVARPVAPRGGVADLPGDDDRMVGRTIIDDRGGSRRPGSGGGVARASDGGGGTGFCWGAAAAASSHGGGASGSSGIDTAREDWLDTLSEMDTRRARRVGGSRGWLWRRRGWCGWLGWWRRGSSPRRGGRGGVGAVGCVVIMGAGLSTSRSGPTTPTLLSLR